MSSLLGVLLVAGSFGLLPLFKFRARRLIKSYLFIKTFMWVPIFAGFVTILYLPTGLKLVPVSIVDLIAYRELRRYWRQTRTRRLPAVYYIGFVLCSLHISLAGLFFDPQQTINFLVTVCFASALSDVMAFFFGNYLGLHKLPEALNSRKSWEGLAGQLAGALLGVGLLRAFGIANFFWLWLPVGIGTALGDLANSYIKRRLGIKDWGKSIPGHGGYLDRFSSLFAGLTVASYALLISL